VKRPLGRPRHIWKDSINMDLKEKGCGAWTGLIWHKIEVNWQLMTRKCFPQHLMVLVKIACMDTKVALEKEKFVIHYYLIHMLCG
jgi:hypothetical protein